MNIQMFNWQYFLALFLCIGSAVALFFILRKRSAKTQKIVLFSILLFALALHFLKALWPPYSTDQSRLYRDYWFINICGASIGLFPFFFISKSDKAKDYMFYMGVISGLLSILCPIEVLQNSNQAAQWIDIIRFYIHHNIIWSVPLFMVIFKLHTLSYKRLLYFPAFFMGVCLFIMINQVLQSELGFIALRGNDMININYKNSSMIWAPTGKIGEILYALCPGFFKTIPVGEYAGQAKAWPWFWLIFPAYILLTPLAFLLCIIFDHKNFKEDCKRVFARKNHKI